MFERIRKVFDRWHALEELAQMSDHDLADLGVSRDQALTLATMPTDVPDRLRAMATIFGLSETDLHRDHATWLEITETCAKCGARPACKRNLVREAVFAGSVLQDEVSFCPNAQSYKGLVASLA